MNVGEPEQGEVGEDLAAEAAGAWERQEWWSACPCSCRIPAPVLTDDEDFALLAEEALRLVAALERDLVGPRTAAGQDAVDVVVPCDHPCSRRGYGRARVSGTRRRVRRSTFRLLSTRVRHAVQGGTAPGEGRRLGQEPVKERLHASPLVRPLR